MAERPIRILYLQPATHFGGAERQAATVVPVLRDVGVEVTPVVGPGQEILAWLEDRGVHDAVFSTSFPGNWRTPRGLARTALAWRYLRCVLDMRSEIERLVVEREIDVIYAAMAFSWVAATPVARKLGIPVVWRAGGSECAPVTRRILSIWSRWNRPDHLVCNGEAVQRLYAPLVRAPSTVIRNGIDREQFRAGSGDGSKLRPPGARLVIGFAGRLVAQKRPEDFIAAAARFAAHDDVAFLLVGDGNLREQCLALAQASGARTLKTLGYVRDMRDFYAACDVLVLPSRSEGCPNVVLEAMAMGTLVIAADTPAVREIVTDGCDGLLYPVGNIDALQAALAMLIECPERRQMMVARAFSRIARLTARECGVRTAGLLRDVVAAHQPAQLPAIARGTELPA